MVADTNLKFVGHTTILVRNDLYTFSCKGRLLISYRYANILRQKSNFEQLRLNSSPDHREFFALANALDRIYITGGLSKATSGCTTSVLIFDLKKCEFQRERAMQDARRLHSSTICGNKLFVLGGSNDAGKRLSSIEMLDVTKRTSTWMIIH